MTKRQIIKKNPKYFPNQTLYALNIYKGKDERDIDSFVKIEKVIIKAIDIDETGISYWLRSIDDDKEWGINVPEETISTNINELFKYLTRLWKI